MGFGGVGDGDAVDCGRNCRVVQFLAPYRFTESELDRVGYVTSRSVTIQPPLRIAGSWVVTTRMQCASIRNATAAWTSSRVGSSATSV
jgi:hypothetical protein